MGDNAPQFAAGDFNFNELAGIDGKLSAQGFWRVCLLAGVADIITNCESELMKTDLFADDALFCRLDEELPMNDLPFDLLDFPNGGFIDGDVRTGKAEVYPQQVCVEVVVLLLILWGSLLAKGEKQMT